MSNMYFSICGLFCISLILFMYFSKERIDSKETNLYGYMIISSFLDIILVLIALIIGYKVGLNDNTSFLLNIINKIDFIHYILWPSLLFLYIFYITYKDTNKYNKVRKIVRIINTILIIIEFCLPLEIIAQSETMGVAGMATNFVYMVAVAYLLLIIFVLIQNIKNIFNKKYLPVAILIIMMIIAVIIRAANPTLIVIPSIIVYINLIMYFTIENPDLKLLNQMELAKTQAEKANAAKTDFLSNMSHEIRTPLNAIVGFSEAIKEADSLEEAKEDAKDIIAASQNLLEIVNGILDISKIEANKMEIINTEYNLKNECELLSKLINARIGEKPITLNVNIAPDIPERLYGDKAKIKEILSNILTNAVKYTKEGQINFVVSCINKGNESSLVFSVEDTGRGIKPENIDKLFNKFERLDEDRNTTIEGAGLGLAITKKLVEMLNGKIIVQSVYGSGSKFTVYLKQRIIDNSNYINQKEAAPKSELILEGKKVLVVDDNEMNLKIANKLLEKYKLTVELCHSGYECLDNIKNGLKYDLILMDDMMPKMSGTETLHILKDDPNFKDRVVVLTANAIEGMKEKYIEEGFDDYLSKPIERNELERVLRKYLNKEIEHVEFAPLPDEMFEITSDAIDKINDSK